MARQSADLAGDGESVMQHSHITPDRLFSLGTAYRCAKVLLCAIELDVFTALDGWPRMAADLARMLGIHNRSACDFFDALVALGLLQRDTDGRYANTMEASLYLDQNKSTYLGGMFNSSMPVNTRCGRSSVMHCEPASLRLAARPPSISQRFMMIRNDFGRL